MTKKWAAGKANPRKPTPKAIARAKLLDETVLSSENRPSRPPGVDKCKVCCGTGCRVCGVKPRHGKWV